MRQEIESALEKENLDRERAMAGEESAAEGEAAGGVKSSAALMGDLEEVRQKIERFQTRRALGEFPEVQTASDAVVNCYKYAFNFITVLRSPDVSKVTSHLSPRLLARS